MHRSKVTRGWPLGFPDAATILTGGRFTGRPCLRCKRKTQVRPPRIRKSQPKQGSVLCRGACSAGGQICNINRRRHQGSSSRSKRHVAPARALVCENRECGAKRKYVVIRARKETFTLARAAESSSRPVLFRSAPARAQQEVQARVAVRHPPALDRCGRTAHSFVRPTPVGGPSIADSRGRIPPARDRVRSAQRPHDQSRPSHDQTRPSHDKPSCSRGT